MTTPTREQVVKLFEQAGETANWKPGFGNDRVIDYLGHFATLARADLEATIAEQAAEISILQSKADALAATVTELVACKNLKNQIEAIRFAGPNSSHGANWKAAASALESNYNLRKPDAWINVCAALTTYKESKQ